MDYNLESKISNVIKHLNNLKKLNNAKKGEFDTIYTIPMALFQIINYTIELGDYIITKKRLGFPQTYSETFDILYESKIITKELQLNLKKLCEYRNIIAHEYHLLNKEEFDEIT